MRAPCNPDTVLGVWCRCRRKKIDLVISSRGPSPGIMCRLFFTLETNPKQCEVGVSNEHLSPLTTEKLFAFPYVTFWTRLTERRP